MQRCMVAGGLARRGAARPAGRRGLSSEATPPPEPGMNPDEPLPPPPNVFAAVGAMGAGALGAVFIAAVGVWGVFKMAFYVASETGRTINADKTAVAGSTGGGEAAAGGGSKAASPLEPRRPLCLLQGLAAPSFAAAAAVGVGSSSSNGWSSDSTG
ncbi:hypothetical protein ABPG75_000541 [Micractinium tetrahymenae]